MSKRNERGAQRRWYTGDLHLHTPASSDFQEPEATYLDLLRSVKTWITTRHTFLTGKKLETQYGLIFQRQCWGVALTYTDRADDQRVGFSIILPGVMEKFKKPPMGPKD